MGATYRRQDLAPSDYDLVFIVTYARSGSTLLQALLNACPGVAIRGENSNALFHLFQTCRALEETRRDFGAPTNAGPVDRPWHGADRIEPGTFAEQALALFLRSVLAPPPTARVTGFKEIRYTPDYMSDEDFAGFMTFLMQRFPRARIVFNSRRADAVAASSFIAREDPADVAEWVAGSDRRFAAFVATTDRAIHMVYDNWVVDRGQIHAMLDFLGLDWTPEAVERVMAKRLTHG